MGKGTDHLGALVERILEPGEELVATVRVSYNGTIAPNTFSVQSRMIDDDAGNPPGEIDPDIATLFPTAGQMAIALTGGRLFVWSLGISGKPKHFLGSVPLSALTSVSGSGTLGRPSLRIAMKSGAKIDLEYLRGEAGVEFTEEIAGLVGPP